MFEMYYYYYCYYYLLYFLLCWSFCSLLQDKFYCDYFMNMQVDSCVIFLFVFIILLTNRFLFSFIFLMFFLVSVCMYTHSRKTNVGKVKCSDFSYSAVWWVSTRGSLLHWKYNSQCSQCREKFLFVRIALGGVCYWHLVKRRGDPANRTTMPRMETYNEELPDLKHQ